MGTCYVAQGAHLMLCDDLEGWDGERHGRSRREVMHVYIELIPFIVIAETNTTL